MLETDGSTATVAGTCPQAFEYQITRYSDLAGITTVASSPAAKGPYVKKGALPDNPFNQLNTVKCDLLVNDITTTATDGSTGWIFYTKTGKLLANDGTHGSY